MSTNGGAIGRVFAIPSSGGIIHDYFVYFGGRIVIAADSDDFTFNDINDDGLIVGNHDAFPFVSSCCGVPFSYGYTGPLPGPNLTGGAPWDGFVRFESIDNSGNILARGANGQFYDLLQSPEPRTVVLFTTMLGGLLLMRRRRKLQ